MDVKSRLPPAALIASWIFPVYRRASDVIESSAAGPRGRRCVFRVFYLYLHLRCGRGRYERVHECAASRRCSPGAPGIVIEVKRFSPTVYAARAIYKNESRAMNVKREVCITPPPPSPIIVVLPTTDRERSSSELIKLRHKKHGCFLFLESLRARGVSFTAILLCAMLEKRQLALYLRDERCSFENHFSLKFVLHLYFTISAKDGIIWKIVSFIPLLSSSFSLRVAEDEIVLLTQELIIV